MSVEDFKITINGIEYELSPLKLKHLKEITVKVAKGLPSGVSATLDTWLPYLLYSIKVKNPNFQDSELDEATLKEITDAADVLLAVSGIVIKNVLKGEQKPADSIGDTSTAG